MSDQDNRGREFNWVEGADHVVVQAQRPVAVHLNPYGDVVVRHLRDWDEDQDPCVVIPQRDALAVARAILKEAGIADEPAPPSRTAAPNSPKDSTAADRQKRYRERRRNGVEAVTRDANESTVTAEARHGQRLLIS